MSSRPQSSFEVDHARLRRDRLAKMQREMAARDLAAVLLVNPVNVRYATGVAVMDFWTSINLARYALVPVHGDPQLFEYSKSLFVAQAVWPGARPAKAWQFRFSQHEADKRSAAWAAELKDLLQGWGLAGGKVGFDQLDWYGVRALEAAGLTLADADEVVVACKLIKTPDEIELLRQSCHVGEESLRAMEQAIRPGVSENELLGVFTHKMLALGGEHCSTRLLVAGQKTNPWFNESGENQVRPGDVVGIDTDMGGIEGYLCDISRTFLCGDRADAEQREAYRVAYDFIQATIDLCRPGISYEELIRKAPAVPEAYHAQSYSCMIHGSGYDDEPPFLPYAWVKGAVVPRGEIRPNMSLSIEFYAGKVGGRSGVKLEEQILVTERGPELLAHYPWDERLLG
jgi:Xaa-Pro aminopeptidase